MIIRHKRRATMQEVLLAGIDPDAVVEAWVNDLGQVEVVMKDTLERAAVDLQIEGA